MILFTTKNLIAAATLAITLPLSAQARPYDVCYADTGDAIGCWLSEKLGGDYIHFGDPETPEESAEVQTLRAKGYMKIDPVKGEMIEKKAGAMKLDGVKGDLKSHEAQAKNVKHVQQCKTGEIIEMIKGKIPAEKIAESCYK
jgi:hypothetical protein